ncbi:hypothetical protein V8F20_011399, partial [Naviculisporaceae sp. PSN 640]
MARSLVWITGFSVVSFVANLLVLLGCISPSSKDLALYRVDVAALAANIVKETRNKAPHNVSELLDSGLLPTFWYWGMSGICDVDEVKGETRCHGGFPSTKTLLAVVEDSLRRNDNGKPSASSNKVLSVWKSVIDNLPDHVLANKQTAFIWQGKASAYLVTAAIILDFASPFLAWIALKQSSSRIHPFTSSAVSGLIILAAGSLAIFSMNNGPRGLTATGPDTRLTAIIILFVNGICRSAFSTAAPKFKLRSRHGIFPEFTEPEWRYSDFTYLNRHSAHTMLAFLDQKGVDSRTWSVETKFHLEVKTTP